MQTTLRRAAAALLAAVIIVAALLVTGGAAVAADQVIRVAPGGEPRFDPDQVTIQVGDEVTFEWLDDGHSVSESSPTDPDNPIESHPDCEGFLEIGGPECAQAGDEPYRWTAMRPGEYQIRCRVHPSVMTGVITVEPPASPSPSPSPEPSETASPSADPSESASPSDDPSSSATPTEDPPPSTDPSPPPSPSPTPPAPSPTPEPVPEAPSVDPVPTLSPSVPVPDPTFEAFPDAAEILSPSESEEVAGAVAVGGNDGGDTQRLLWALVGGFGVLGTLGAIGHTIVHSDVWQP